MTEVLHNMPEIPQCAVQRIVDKFYLFPKEVVLIADSFTQPPERLMRMRLVRNALLQMIQEYDNDQLLATGLDTTETTI